MAKHTPGPWRFEPETMTIRSEPANYWLASMNSWDGAVDHDANARLFAAAPDMLAALQRAETRLYVLSNNGRDVPVDDMDAVRAAIAKAEGRMLAAVGKAEDA